MKNTNPTDWRERLRKDFPTISGTIHVMYEDLECYISSLLEEEHSKAYEEGARMQALIDAEVMKVKRKKIKYET